VYSSDYSTEIFISWPTITPDVPNVHARQTRLPRCKCNQRRRWRHRWYLYPTATGVVGHIEPLGTVAARAVFSSNPPKCSKLLLSISATDFKDFRQNHAGDRPSSGQGSYQRWRERGVHRSRTDTPSSEVVRMFRRSRLQNVAHLAEHV
jgi:hypothetical protein